MKTQILSAATLAFTLAAILSAGEQGKQKDKKADLAAQLDAAASRASGEKFELKYKFAPDQSVRYRVEHLVVMDTTIEGNRQRARSRSLSTKVWDIQRVDDFGAATFVHQVTDADMWHQVSGFVMEDGKQVAKQKEHRYKSNSDQPVPLHYQHIANSIGKPLAEVTVDASGALIDREDKVAGGTWGGQLIVPLPPEPVVIGQIWHKPQEFRVRQPGGTVVLVKLRQQYELKSVEDDLATIEMNTQILTPGIRDKPRVMAQIAQRLTDGTIEFNIAQGRILRQVLKLDETIIGFNGPKSIMSYTGRFTEELLTADGEIARTAAK